MAPPHGEKSTEVKEEPSAVSSVDNRPISTIVFIIAMQTEALPLVNKFQLTEDVDSVFPKGVPWVRFYGNYKGFAINIVCPGKDPALGVDGVGTVSISLVTYASVQALKPDLIINAGTAGGFGAKGASIGDVFLSSEVAFHDRRIPIPEMGIDNLVKEIPDYLLESSTDDSPNVFDIYGVGSRKAFATPNLLKELNLKMWSFTISLSVSMVNVMPIPVLYLLSSFRILHLSIDNLDKIYQIKVGKLSTGDSLDMSPVDEAAIVANDATVKDMEGAAVAYVADLLKVPVIFLKAVTDIVDGDKPTPEEFLANLAAVTAALDQTATQVVDYISGKCLLEL
ncbi:5'-methylthioadenosine/S-adenosylhomocysteine nucleosidase 1 [Capsicum annuum]|nr:5'-methylthioadenosine/S-adenosylhomocysteine nucleosidase 1 [Capsicum annuum]